MSKDGKKSKKLDEATEKTFPASDPINVGPHRHRAIRQAVDRAPPLITKDQIEAAQRGEGHAHLDTLPSSVDEKIRHEKHHGLADEGNTTSGEALQDPQVFRSVRDLSR
jgi:hypothetical protein